MTAAPGPLRTRNDALFETLELYLVAAPWHADHFDRRPFGVEIPAGNVIDPTRVASATFLDRLETLDRLTFGGVGMPMPRWVFWDAAEMTGAICGFACRLQRLAPELAARLEAGPSARGLMPLSMYIAIPARPPEAWLGHNLASLNRLLPELKLRSLATITKAMALRVFRCRGQIGAVQWASPALRIHTRFGPLQMLSAWTPAHSDPGTITYRIDVTEASLRGAMGDPAAKPPAVSPTLHVGIEDEAAMRRLQADIEAGGRYVVAGPPRRGDDGAMRVPVSRLSAAAAG